MQSAMRIGRPAVNVGGLRFDQENRVLYDGSQVVPLAPLPAQMLAELLRAGGDVVPAAAMREALWGDAAVEDRNLNQQMYVLRRALRCEPRVTIENVPRRGYRLVVAPAATPHPRSVVRYAWLCVALALIAATVLAVRAQERRAAIAALDRDLAVADFVAMSEGPDHLGRAAKYYRAAIAVSPGSARAYGGLALVDAKHAVDLAGEGRSRTFELARTEAKAALARDKTESSALTALGIVAAVHERRPDMARRLFDAAVAADPYGESPRSWRARFFLSTGDLVDAARDFRILSEIAPTSAGAVGSFGMWLVLHRDYGRAASVLSQAVVLGTHPAFTRYWLARSYHLRGLDAKALPLANILVALYPDEPAAIVVHMRVEAGLGNTRAALADFDRLMRVPHVMQLDPIAYASADVAMGRRSDAVRVLRTYRDSGSIDIDNMLRLRTDPDFDPIRKQLSS